MFYRNWIIAIFFSFLAGLFPVAGYAQKKPCTDDEGRRAVDQANTLRSWDALYQSYKTFGNCDEGAIGEGFIKCSA